MDGNFIIMKEKIDSELEEYSLSIRVSYNLIVTGRRVVAAI